MKALQTVRTSQGSARQRSFTVYYHNHRYRQRTLEHVLQRTHFLWHYFSSLPRSNHPNQFFLVLPICAIKAFLSLFQALSARKWKARENMSACYGRRGRWREKGSPPPFLSPVLSRLFPCSLFLNFVDPIISEPGTGWACLYFFCVCLQFWTFISVSHSVLCSADQCWNRVTPLFLGWLTRYSVCKKTYHWLECRKMHLHTATQRYSWNNRPLGVSR